MAAAHRERWEDAVHCAAFQWDPQHIFKYEWTLAFLRNLSKPLLAVRWRATPQRWVRLQCNHIISHCVHEHKVGPLVEPTVLKLRFNWNNFNSGAWKTFKGLVCNYTCMCRHMRVRTCRAWRLIEAWCFVLIVGHFGCLSKLNATKLNSSSNNWEKNECKSLERSAAWVMTAKQQVHNSQQPLSHHHLQR